MYKIKKTFSALLTTSTLLMISACTSQPREVTASIELVSYSTAKPTKKIIPQQYWSILSNPNQHSFTHSEYQIKMNALYISALGDTCRELEFTDKKNIVQKHITCKLHFIDTDKKQDDSWFNNDDKQNNSWFSNINSVNKEQNNSPLNGVNKKQNSAWFIEKRIIESSSNIGF